MATQKKPETPADNSQPARAVRRLTFEELAVETLRSLVANEGRDAATMDVVANAVAKAKALD
jgi:hypothetical protein